MNWKRYSTTALNAFVSAAAGSISSGSVASYLGVNAKTSLKIAGLTALVSGIVSAAKWIAQHPIPGAPTS